MDVPIQQQLRQLSRLFPRSPELAVSQEMLEAYDVYRWANHCPIVLGNATPMYGPHRLTVWPEVIPRSKFFSRPL